MADGAQGRVGSDPAGRGGWYGAITQVPGLRVGHAGRIGAGWLSGVTVVLPPPGTVGAVDVRGGGPGTHETDALDPSTLVPTVDAVCLTGGSAYGLAAAGGVQAWCGRAGRGFPVGPPTDPGSLVVPIVPAAAVFDLGRGGDPRARPDADLGYRAAEAAGSAPGTGAGAADPGPEDPEAAGRDRPGAGTRPEGPGWDTDPDGAGRNGPGAGTGAVRGCVGAGTGALLAGGRLKGGVGTACVRAPGGAVVGAIVVVNALGSPVDPVTGGLLGAAHVPAGLPRPGVPDADQARALASRLSPPDGPQGGGSAGFVPAANTTLAVVATDAVLDPARTRRMAVAAHDGLARALNPAHTLLDGDTVFALATGTRTVPEAAVPWLHAAAADAVLLAVLDAVLAATGTRTPALDVPGYADLCPSALR